MLLTPCQPEFEADLRHCHYKFRFLNEYKLNLFYKYSGDFTLPSSCDLQTRGAVFGPGSKVDESLNLRVQIDTISKYKVQNENNPVCLHGHGFFHK